MKRRLFIGMLLTYLVLLVSKKTGLFFPELINSYLSDLLCIPLVLSIARYAIAYWINDACFQLNRWHMAFTSIAFALVFELILPKFSTVYTADPFDALAYGIGALLFDRLQSPVLIAAAQIHHTEVQ